VFSAFLRLRPKDMLKNHILDMNEILGKLEGGDRRSIGRADEVVSNVLEDPALLDALFQGIYSDDALVRMRTADAVEKISAKRPEYLQPYKQDLLQVVSQIEQQEVRWHLAQMIPGWI
jgi:hypothetical protein